MDHDEYRAAVISQIVDIAKGALAGTVSILQAARELAELLSEAGVEDDEGELVNLFKTIDSETDHLPLGSQRQQWDAVSLKRKDSEIVEYERAFREEVLRACRTLISKYSSGISGSA